MRFDIILAMLILFSSSYSFAQTRANIVKNKIEKVIITSKNKYGFNKTTRVFDIKGNIVSETMYGETNLPPDSTKDTMEYTFLYQDTFCIKAIGRMSYSEDGENGYINDTTEMSYKLDNLGRVTIETQTSSASPTRKTILHYNKKGLLDTLRHLSNEPLNGPAQKRFIIDDFYIIEEYVYQYDSLRRIKKETIDLIRDRLVFKEPLVYKYSYINDTTIQENFRWEKGNLVPQLNFIKSYSNAKYSIEKRPYETIETFITRNKKGLKIYEKIVAKHQYNGISTREIYYKYQHRKN